MMNFRAFVKLFFTSVTIVGDTHGLTTQTTGSVAGFQYPSTIPSHKNGRKNNMAGLVPREETNYLFPRRQGVVLYEQQQHQRSGAFSYTFASVNKRPTNVDPMHRLYLVTPTAPLPQQPKRPSSSQMNQSSVPVEMPSRRRFSSWAATTPYKRQRMNTGLTTVMSPPRPQQQRTQLISSTIAKKTDDATTATAAKQTTKPIEGLSKLDVALFVTYFCNMAVINLSVVTVPALAAEHIVNPKTMAAFMAGVASLAPLGGGFGKIINGFVCQRLGGRRASWMYLMAMSVLSLGMTLCKSVDNIGLILIGFEFLASIQWTSICYVLAQHYWGKPQHMARGIAVLGLSSTLGALAAKTFGAALLKYTNWRTVSAFGALIGMAGTAAMYAGVNDNDAPKKVAPSATTTTSQQVDSSSSSSAKSQSPLQVLKSILRSKLFWQIGLAHSVGYLARGSDRLLGTFIHEVSALPQHLCASLTSCVTLGLLAGVCKGKKFSQLVEVKQKMKMLNKNYSMAIVSALGLAGCGLNGVMKLIANPIAMAGLVALFGGLLSSTVAFQFYQLPNLVSSTMFEENASVSLSLIDAAGYFATAQVLTANTHVLGNFGWSASWGFLAIIFGVGGLLANRAMGPVLLKSHADASSSSR